MKICHIISNTNTGGAELSMLAHLKLFSNPKKYQTSVISLTTIGVIGIKIQRECQIPVYEVGISRDIRSILKLSRFVKLIGGIKPDVIIAWMYHANILSALLFPQICVIWNIRHSLEYFESENYLTRVLIRGGRFLSTRPHRIIYNSLNSKEQHEISFGYCTERSQTINNGVDCVRYQPKNNDNRKKISIGIAGRYHPIKNHELFFQVLKKIIENHHHVIAVSAGRGMNENNFELFQRLQYWGLTEHVVLLDELEDMNIFIII